MKEQMSVILLCGGKGTRMNSSVPKQFLSLDAKPIALYSFDIFKTLPEVSEIIVVTEPEYQNIFLQNHLSIPLRFALPGERRQDSVFNGLNASQSNSTYICIHDGARPFIDELMVKRVFESALEHGAAVAGMPLKFTLKEHNGNGFVKNTPERSKFWEIQTPQIIRRNILQQGFQEILARNLDVTDDVSIVEHLGLQVKLVEGSAKNLKLTTPEDLLMAHFLLQHQT